MAGQVAYHLLTQAGVTRAPWEVTTLVSCLPVAVLGMGSALAHLLRSDASSADAQAKAAGLQTGDQKLTEQWPPDFSGLDQPGPGGFGPSAWPGSGAPLPPGVRRGVLKQAGRQEIGWVRGCGLIDHARSLPSLRDRGATSRQISAAWVRPHSGSSHACSPTGRSGPGGRRPACALVSQRESFMEILSRD
jgi:hypothetical protein